MPQADFYMVDRSAYRDDPLHVVCVLARRAFEARQALLIFARDAEQAQALDEKLWAFAADAYLPHQIAGEEDDAITPVLIVPPETKTPDRPLAINLRDEPAPGVWQRVLEVVPADPNLRAGARQRWKAYAQRGVLTVKHEI